jgi:hypothetical protein
MRSWAATNTNFPKESLTQRNPYIWTNYPLRGSAVPFQKTHHDFPFECFIIICSGKKKKKSRYDASASRPGSTVAAKTIAALRAVKFCRSQGLERIELEGDSLQVVNSINKCGITWNVYGHLVEDIKQVLQYCPDW